MSVDAARRAAEKVNGTIARGENPAETRRTERSQATFQELFDLYLERHARRHKRTWKEDKAKYDLYLKDLGKRKLGTINRALISRLHSDIGSEHQTTANRVLALVSSVFNRAREWGMWETTNPCEGIRRYRELSRERFLQPFEMPIFFRAVIAESNEIIRDYVLLSLLTGARRSNVLSMRWKDVDLLRREWYIARTKNESSMTVTLAPEAVEVLRNRMAVGIGEYVFPGTGKRGHLEEPKKGWKRILARADALGLVEALARAQNWDPDKVKDKTSCALTDPTALLAELEREATIRGLEHRTLTDLRIHDLRRSLGSWQARTGASLVTIGRSLGHKSSAATVIYARLDNDPVRQSVDTAVSAIMNASGLDLEQQLFKMKVA